ncbi:MAG: hypothetical protein QNI88_16300 [Desulfobacterales bacterium]|nr:hypothetical protein [Desulfobacterales bacterium]
MVDSRLSSVSLSASVSGIEPKRCKKNDSDPNSDTDADGLCSMRGAGQRVSDSRWIFFHSPVGECILLSGLREAMPAIKEEETWKPKLRF